MWPQRTPMIWGLGPVALAAVLRRLAKQLCLQGKDVIEHPIDPPAFQPVVRNHARALQMAAQGGSQRPVDPRLPSNLGLLEQLQATVEGKLAEPVLPDGHRAVLTCLELRHGRHRSLVP